ncbi:MAG TPA: response regulator [Anaeromyxobacteraceae bacterium]|nr:response regulator [Anaeromyxobacteraceae bacterium]
MGAKGTILVVEDDPGIRDTIAELLESEGYRVVPARHGGEALELLATLRPDVMVLDLVMPVMDGGQLLARLRADAALGALPVVLMTGAATWGRKPLPRADHLLPKPFELDDLLTAVRRLATRRG